MILNKVLTSAGGYEPGGQRDLCLRIITHLRQNPPIKEWENDVRMSDLLAQLAEPCNTWVVLRGYLSAYLQSNAMRSRIVLALEARYEWRGFEKFECVVVFDTGLEPLRRRGFVSNHTAGGKSATGGK